MSGRAIAGVRHPHALCRWRGAAPLACALAVCAFTSPPAPAQSMGGLFKQTVKQAAKQATEEIEHRAQWHIAESANQRGHLILSMTVGASFSTQYQPTGLSFAIAGNAYSASAGGGTVAVSPDVVAFRGGAYDGWKGARLNDAIVFRKNDHSNPQADGGIRAGDVRCAWTSG